MTSHIGSIGTNNGTVVNGANNGQIITGPPAPPTQPYSVKRRRLLPVTERGLNFAASIVGLLGAFSLWGVLKDLLRGPEASATSSGPFSGFDTAQVLPLMGLGACALLILLLVPVRRLVKHRLLATPHVPLLPTLAGVDDPVTGRGRLAVTRLEGQCVVCSGELRFYSKPTEWHSEKTEFGFVKRVVDARQPAAECKRNPEHWSEIDITDRLF